MADKLALMQEAYKRGILPEDKKALYEEAARRGLIGQVATNEQQDMVDIPSRMARGAMDPVTGLGQMLYNAVPESVQQVGTNVDKWLYEKTGGVLGADRPFNQKVADEESVYQQARQATGQEGIDWARLGGNVLSPANLAIASRVPVAGTLGGRVAQGAGLGTVFGAAQPVTEGDYWGEKGKQALTGAVAGGVLPVATGAFSRVISPKTSPQVQQLMQEGVTPTPGQILGGGFKRAEEGLTSLPILGDAIKAGQRRGIEQLNRAAMNRALSPLGEKLPPKVEVGQQAVAYVRDKFTNAYETLLPKLSGKMDKQFTAEIGSLKGLTRSLPDAQRKQFDRIIKNEITSRFTKAGLASGETLKNIQSKLGEISRGYAKSSDYDQRSLGKALQEAQASLMRMIERNNPNYASELRNVNAGYSNFLRTQNAASRLGSKDGIFTPGQLRGAVRALDSSKGKGAFARGQAQMQDLADAAETVLAPKVPDSGTPFRTMVNIGALGGGAMVNPVIPASGIAAAIPYSRAGQEFAAAMLARRPQLAKPVADAIRKTSPALTPGFVNLVSDQGKN